MNPFPTALLICMVTSALATAAPLGIASLGRDGTLHLTNTYGQGVVTVEESGWLPSYWGPRQNSFTTNTSATAIVPVNASGQRYYRAYATDLTPGIPNGRPGFTNLTKVYGLLQTVAGTGFQGAAGLNSWRPEFEGAPATTVELSRPHIAMADKAGNIYIADKEAHAIRKVLPNGTLITVAGTNLNGNGTDAPTPGTLVALWDPNGLFVLPDGTVYILDQGNGKVRRLDTNGILTTVLADPNGISAGRGLWVNLPGTEMYYSSGTVVRKWTQKNGISTLATGFVELGNLDRHPITGEIVATDRAGHRVWSIAEDGSLAVLAGDGTAGVGVDGGVAADTPLNQVRAVAFLPTGAYFLGTHRGSQIWYVDTDGFIHLVLNGSTSDTHGGDGTWFYNPSEYRVSEVRAVTVDYDGNLLITEHDAGFVRRVFFLPHLQD